MNFERDTWVSCKDMLPDDQRNVLFVYRNPFYSRNEVHYGFYLPKTELHDARWSSKDGPSYNERQIIWWRDVPLAPPYTKD